jgi:hypothetical protein
MGETSLGLCDVAVIEHRPGGTILTADAVKKKKQEVTEETEN